MEPPIRTLPPSATSFTARAVMVSPAPSSMSPDAVLHVALGG